MEMHRTRADAEGMLKQRPWEGARPWTSTAARLLLAAVLGVAGLLQLPDPAQSVRAVRGYDLLPEGVVQAVGYGLPVLEVALAVLLLLGLATRLAAVGTAVALAAGAPVVVTVCENFLCPACRAADGVLGATDDDLLDQAVMRSTTDAASRAGLNATPTILVDGTPLREWSDQALRTAVTAARSAG